MQSPMVVEAPQASYDLRFLSVKTVRRLGSKFNTTIEG
jgi:hypothetical protein